MLNTYVIVNWQGRLKAERATVLALITWISLMTELYFVIPFSLRLNNSEGAQTY